MSEVFANLTFSGGERLPITRENATVYNHYGMGELYDHVFVQTDEEKGVYVWAQIPPDNPAYALLAPTCVENDCEVHVNIKKVAEGDLKAFGRAALSDLEEYPDWLDEV